MPNHYSISITNDDSDEIPSRMRVGGRRRRKKQLGSRSDDTLSALIFHFVVRYWTFLIFVPAITILVFYELPRVFGTSQPPLHKVRNSPPKVKDATSNEELSISNLGRLDVRTRAVNGVREPCLRILPVEELQQLEFPKHVEPSLPVTTVVYKSEQDSSFVASSALSQQHVATTRFNLFTGNQTLHEREESFKVNETAVVHCGFYSQRGGFDISDEDKTFMHSCKAVVTTCAFGGGDDLYQPIGMTEASLREVCYVAFWDEITRTAQKEEGKIIGKDGMIGRWRVVVVRNLPFSDQRLNGKIPKMLGHRLFPLARYSIWVDSKSQFRRDPLGVFEALLWRTNSVLAISEHGARSSVYDEAKAVVKKHKASPEEVEVQMTQYHSDGFPDDKRFNGKKALSEASVIVREHTAMSNLLMCLWFNEVVRFTSRDQLSFPYVLRRLKYLNVNMFPVCIRKDLVNSIGHKRKVKPLRR